MKPSRELIVTGHAQPGCGPCETLPTAAHSASQGEVDVFSCVGLSEGGQRTPGRDSTTSFANVPMGREQRAPVVNTP